MNPNEKGRGKLLYIRKDMEYKKINDDSGFEELQVFNLILTEGEVVIASTYWSPSSTHENNSNLNNFSRKIGSSRSRYIVLGDMNFRDVDRKYVSTNHDENSKEHHFIEAVKDSYLDQHVDRPTRVTKHNEPSLLDLLLTDKTLEPSSIEYISPLGKGDYTLLQAKFNLWTTRRSKERLNYNTGSYDELRSDFKNNLIYEDLLTLDQNWNKFKNTLDSATKKFIPKMKIRIKQHKLPMSSEVRDVLRDKHKTCKDFKKEKSQRN